MDANIPGVTEGVRRYRAGRVMSPYVYCYELADESTVDSGVIHLHPSGGVSLIVNLGDALTFQDQIVGRGVFLDGVSVKSVMARVGAKPDLLRIVFKPGMFPLFFKANLKRNPLREKVDVAAGGFQGKEPFLTYLDTLEDDASMIVSVESWLSCRLGAPSAEAILVIEAIHHITDSHFDIRLDDLVEKMKVDGRRLQRLFAKYVGMSPKKLTKLMRLTAARELLSEDERLSCMDITYRCGYYDQAHFNREFKEVIGLTPNEYRHRFGDYPLAVPRRTENPSRSRRAC